MVLTNDNQRKLEDLRYKVSQFAETLLRATHQSFEDSPKTLDTLDTCIDQWNVVINRAPSVLKSCKLEVLDAADKRTSDPNPQPASIQPQEKETL